MESSIDDKRVPERHGYVGSGISCLALVRTSGGSGNCTWADISVCTQPRDAEVHRVCTCLSRADGIGSMHGHHDEQCPLSKPVRQMPIKIETDPSGRRHVDIDQVIKNRLAKVSDAGRIGGETSAAEPWRIERARQLDSSAASQPESERVCLEHCGHAESEYDAMADICRAVMSTAFASVEYCGHRCFPAPSGEPPPKSLSCRLGDALGKLHVINSEASLLVNFTNDPNLRPKERGQSIQENRLEAHRIICEVMDALKTVEAETPLTVEAASDKVISSQFHKLWTSQVGTEGYNKKDWQELRRLLDSRGIRV